MACIKPSSENHAGDNNEIGRAHYRRAALVTVCARAGSVISYAAVLD